MEITDALLEQMAKGDEEAFRQVFNRYWDVVYYFIRNNGGTVALAEQCAQETLSAVWRRRADLTTVEAIQHNVSLTSRNYALKIIKDTVAMTVQLKRAPEEVADTSVNLWTREIIRLAKDHLDAQRDVSDSQIKTV